MAINLKKLESKFDKIIKETTPEEFEVWLKKEKLKENLCPMCENEINELNYCEHCKEVVK